MNIILLEDDPAQADSITGWLDAAGHHCRVAGTGAEFTQILNRADFDMLILDWELPDTTGIDMLNLVRSTVNWHVPVLFVTCLLYTSPSPRDRTRSRMPSSA